MRAAEILGGTEALQRYLNAPGGNLRRWMQGRERLPDDIFLRIADLLADSEMNALRGGSTGA